MRRHDPTVTSTLAALLAILEHVADRNGDRMPIAVDHAYQLVAAHGAGIARVCGDEALAERLDVAAITCHHCDPT